MLRSGFILLAQRLQEAADMAHSNVRSILSDAVLAAHKGTGSWASYVDHTGDGESGDCIYNCDGDMKRAPYEIQNTGGKASANVDTSKAEKVIPTMQYQAAADDEDNYSAMHEAFKATNIYLDLPIYERFISKAERDAADEGSFAGKNKSYPILKPADVSAAVHAMGRAGSDNFGSAKLKANIIRIAKAKGWAGELPSAWATEAAKTTEAENVPRETSGLKLVESTGVELLGSISVTEAARSTYPIKVISPGTGSSAHYPAKVVEQMAPLVKPGTLMFWNHQTPGQEAERPEGDLDHLAAIITKQGEWMDNGPKGPGVYAEAKVMADYAQKVEERAPHIGLSIRAGGTTTGKTVNGKPELKSIDHIESIDYVTKAGRGGLALVEAAKSAGLLTEAARHAATQNTGDDMTVEQQNVLKEAGRLVLHGEARRVAISALSDISLTESAKEEVIRRVTQAIPTKEGLLDETPFREAVKAEAKAVGAFAATLTGSGQVRFMGAPAPAQVTEAQREEQRLFAERSLKESVDIFADLTGNPTAAKFAAKGRAA
jgi:hypothetical protein